MRKGAAGEVLSPKRYTRSIRSVGSSAIMQNLTALLSTDVRVRAPCPPSAVRCSQYNPTTPRPKHAARLELSTQIVHESAESS